MQSILLTGSHGYLGRRLHRALIDSGHSVTRLLRQPPTEADAVTYDDLARLKKSFDFVIHTATLYRRNGESEEQVREANVNQPARLLEWIRTQSPSTVFLNIDTALRPEINLYAETKREFRQKLLANETPFLNVVLDQFYGPGDSEKKFHIWLTRQLLFSKEPIPLTSGEQIRNFIHIENLIRILVTLVNPTGPRGLIRLMGPETVQVRELATLICQLTGQPLSRLEFGKIPQRITGADELAPIGDATLLTATEPLIHLREGMAAVVEYELRHQGEPQG